MLIIFFQFGDLPCALHGERQQDVPCRCEGGGSAGMCVRCQELCQGGDLQHSRLLQRGPVSRGEVGREVPVPQGVRGTQVPADHEVLLGQRVGLVPTARAMRRVAPLHRVSHKVMLF